MSASLLLLSLEVEVDLFEFSLEFLVINFAPGEPTYKLVSDAYL